MVQTKRFTGLLELVQLYKQNPLEKFSFSPFTKIIGYIGFNNHTITTLLWQKEASDKSRSELLMFFDWI